MLTMICDYVFARFFLPFLVDQRLVSFGRGTGRGGVVSGILFLFVDMTHSVDLLYCVFSFLVHLTGHDPCADQVCVWGGGEGAGARKHP